MKYHNKKDYAISYLKHQQKQNIINSLQTGDLIKLKSDYHPFVFHYGIVQRQPDTNELFIIHNHPDKTNNNGGNTVKEPLNDWIKGKEILSVEKTNVNNDELEGIYNGLKSFKYDFFHYNCEHFVNFVKDKETGYMSSQVIKYTSIAVVGLLFYYLYYKKSKK